MDKMMLRRKAMEAMMKDAPSVKPKKPLMEMEEEEMPEMPEMGEEGEGEEEQEGGYLQMMVSPEEKQMILKMRKMKGKGGVEREDAAEMEY